MLMTDSYLPPEANYKYAVTEALRSDFAFLLVWVCRTTLNVRSNGLGEKTGRVSGDDWLWEGGFAFSSLRLVSGEAIPKAGTIPF